MCSISHNSCGGESGPKHRARLTIKSMFLITMMVRAMRMVFLCNSIGPPAHKVKTSFIQREGDMILVIMRGKKKNLRRHAAKEEKRTLLFLLAHAY